MKDGVRALVLWAAVSSASPIAQSLAVGNDAFTIIDPQKWVNPDDMTWDDYVKPPGTDWNNPNRTGSIRNFKIALVTVDYPDEEFTITKASNSTVFGNPQQGHGSVQREDVPEYYKDLLNTVNDLNLGHTLHEYWMEDSGGRYGVSLDAFGPYRLPRKSFQYGLDNGRGGFNEGVCPEPPCAVSLRTDALGAWRVDIGNATADTYELAFILSAGQDESSTWQEFGEMKFQSREDVPDSFGPSGNDSLPNWAKTRYVEWTSFAAAQCIWPNAGGGSSTQAESSGSATYAHELSHLIGIGDNYNNPYSNPPRRAYTGIWSMMSRGSFNGPSGPHTRWQIPALQGASLGSQHTIRDKLQLGLMSPTSLLNLTLTSLLLHGPATTTLTARSILPSATDLKGLRIHFETDRSPPCNTTLSPLCDGGAYNFYDLEAIQRIGADSFTPDAGVLLSKGKTSDRVQPFQWVIDANPQDIRLVDYVRPNGSAAFVTVGDYRQLADALFHAGTRSGSRAEYVDVGNGLHFYVFGRQTDELGVLRYVVGARALSATAQPGEGGYTLGTPAVGPGVAAAEDGRTCTFVLERAKGNETAEVPVHFRSAILRASASVVEGGDWDVVLPNELFASAPGSAQEVLVGVKPAGSEASRDVRVRLGLVDETTGQEVASGECAARREEWFIAP